MWSIKRAWWAIVLCCLALLAPRESSAREFDPYARRNLTGLISFEYEKYRSVDETGFEEEINTFHQFYSLDLRGNLVSRSLLIYDLGVSWDANKYTTEFQEVDTTLLNYSLSTTMLPLSQIPLTLFFNRFQTKTTGTSSEDILMTTYGANWLLDFWTLPRTRLAVERRLTEGEGTDTEELTVTANLQKVIGASDNNLDYRFDVDQDINSTSPSARETKEHTWNFTNLTNLSRSTSVRLGYIHNIVTHPENHTDDILNQALNALVESTPSDDFHQSHSYTWYKRDANTDTESVGQSYNGNMSYNLTSKLDSSASLGISDSRDTNPQSFFESRALTTSGALNYRPTQHLAISGIISYNDYSTNSEAGKANLGKRKTLNARTLVRYARNLDWSRLNSYYSLGYVEDEADVEGQGTGIEQDVFLGLSGIDFLKYAGVNVSAHYYYLESITGNIWGRRIDYHASTYNLKGAKYVNLNFAYDKDNESGYLEEILNREMETFRFTALSKYFKNTSLAVSAERSNRSEELAGDSHTTSGNASASHQRRLLGGMLNLSVSYQIIRSEGNTTTDTTSSISYKARYRRRLLRRVLWELDLERLEEDFENVTEGFSNTTTAKNSLLYWLRAWQLRFEHTWDRFETDFFERTDNTFYLKATRRFRRFF